MKISMQFFGALIFEKQRTAGLKKTIIYLSDRISEHKEKIADPSSIYGIESDSFSEKRKAGAIKHWTKEIKEFEFQLEQA